MFYRRACAKRERRDRPELVHVTAERPHRSWLRVESGARLWAAMALSAMLCACGRVGVVELPRSALEPRADAGSQTADAGSPSTDASSAAPDAGSVTDASVTDAGSVPDASGVVMDAESMAPLDAGSSNADAGVDAAAQPDSGPNAMMDATNPDADAMTPVDASATADAAGMDAATVMDAGDAGPPADTSVPDAGAIDAGPGPCTWTDFGAPELLMISGLSGSAWGPALTSDGLTLYFAHNDGSDEEIVSATRATANAAMLSALSVLPNVQSSAYDGTPFVTRDGAALYFYSMRSGGVGDRDLWWAQRQGGGAFGTPSLVPNVNSTNADYLPRLSADELTLVFTSNRSGNDDVWFATRSSSSAMFGTPAPLSELNTSDYEGAATLSSDALSIIFVSDRPGGSGSKDLWMATRTSTQATFGAPKNLSSVNSASSDVDCALSADDRELLFVSYRSGARVIWRALRSCN